MLKGIDHIGIVVEDTDQVNALLSDLLGFTIVESVEFPEQGFKSTIIKKEGVQLELIEPMGPKGFIQKFIKKRGRGLHHISLQVDDICEETKLLKRKGVRLVNVKPQQINETSEILFLHPGSTAGVLIELIERKTP